jgi:hypothetical protein
MAGLERKLASESSGGGDTGDERRECDKQEDQRSCQGGHKQLLRMEFFEHLLTIECPPGKNPSRAEGLPPERRLIS